MEQSRRKYMILDTRAKTLVPDDQSDPLRFVTLEQALTKAAALRGCKSAEAFAVVDDLSNKWLWSAKKVLRVALSSDTKDVIYDAVDTDWIKTGSTRQIRCRPDGIIETSHHVRLPDGPPIPVMLHGRPMGDRTTTERWLDKPEWFERGTLGSFIDALPTRIHKLEQRAMNEKARVLRAQEKAIQMQVAYEAGDEMTCQRCGRRICSKFGAIAHHGYTRPGGGWQTASCDGTHHSPLEVSNAHLVETIANYDARCERQKSKIAAVRLNGEPVVVSVKPHWNEGRKAPYVYMFTAETYDDVRAASDGRLSETFEVLKGGYLSELESSPRLTKSILGELRERNANWKQTRVFVDGEFKAFVCEETA
jgi:hypothetical protein